MFSSCKARDVPPSTELSKRMWVEFVFVSFQPLYSSCVSCFSVFLLTALHVSFFLCVSFFLQLFPVYACSRLTSAFTDCQVFFFSIPLNFSVTMSHFLVLDGRWCLSVCFFNAFLWMSWNASDSFIIFIHLIYEVSHVMTRHAPTSNGGSFMVHKAFFLLICNHHKQYNTYIHI